MNGRKGGEVRGEGSVGGWSCALCIQMPISVSGNHPDIGIVMNIEDSPVSMCCKKCSAIISDRLIKS